MVVARGAILLLLTASAAADTSVGEKDTSPGHCFTYDENGDVNYGTSNCGDGEYCQQGKCEKCPAGTVMPSDKDGMDKSWCKKVPKGYRATSIVGVPFTGRHDGSMFSTTEKKIYTNLYPYANGGISACTGDEYQDEVGQVECKKCPDGQYGAKEYSDSTAFDKICGSTAVSNSDARVAWDSSSADNTAVCEAKAEIGQNGGNTRCVSCDTSAADGGPAITGTAFTVVVNGERSQCQQPGSTCGQGYAQEGSVCFECPVGKYTAEADCTADNQCSKCTDCPAGKTTTAAGKHLATGVDATESNSVCTYVGCEKGYYCPGGTDAFRCPVGTFSGYAPYKDASAATIEVGFSECSTCASGTTTVGAMTCDAASVDDATCALGYIKDGKECKACNNGTFSNQLDATECTPCPEGYISGYFDERWDYGKDWEYAGGVNGASTCSKCPDNKVVNGSNCSYCEPGTTLFQGAVAATWDQRDWPETLKKAAGPSCWKCGPGTFSNASTVIDYGCPYGGENTKATGNWITSSILAGNEESVPNGDLNTRAECQAVLSNYAMGGACFPCPAGQVSAKPFGSTECMTCPDGTFPSADRGSCVTSSIAPWIILCLILLVAFLCLAPCLTAKFGKLGFIPIKGYRLKTAHVFLFIALVVALCGGLFGVAKSQLAPFAIVGLFLVACVPAWCAALYPMEEGLPKVQQQM